MAFRRQLILLLWKNFTIKRRSWFLTPLEIFLPLFLCFILLALRTTGSAEMEPVSYYEAKPLPSAGLLPLIELTCDNYSLDDKGFRVLPNSSTTWDLLETIDLIARWSANFPANSNVSWLDALLDGSLSREVPLTVDLLTRPTDLGVLENISLLRNNYSIFNDESEELLMNASDVLSRLYSFARYFPITERCSRKYFNDVTGDDGGNIASGLLYLFTVAQNVVCGVNDYANDTLWSRVRATLSGDANPEQQTSKSETGNPLHLDSYVWRLLQGRPRIFYSPNGTAADLIIKKMNGTVELVAEVIMLAEKILSWTVPWSFADKMNLYGNGRNTAVVMSQTRHIQAAACSLVQECDQLNLDLFVGFRDEESLVHHALNDAPFKNITVFTSLVFDTSENESLPAHIAYTIRQNVSLTPTTRSARALFRYPGPRAYEDSYYRFGFLFLQDLIERAIVELVNGAPILEPGSYIHLSPFPCFLFDNFLQNLENIFSLVLTVSWVYTVAFLVQNIVYEKERRLQEVMYVMGMDRNVLWTSWFFTVFASMTVTMILLTILLWKGRLLPMANPFLVFLLLEEFAAATILFAILLSTFHSRSKVATACAGIIYFLSYLPCLFVEIREASMMVLVSTTAKIFSSFSSTSAFGLAVRHLVYFEMNGYGCNFGNFYTSPVDDESFSVAHVMVILLFDCFLYTLCALYIDMVFPGRESVASHWYFPVEPIARFVAPLFIKRRARTVDLSSAEDECNGSTERCCKFEAEPTGAEIFVKLEHVYKKFSGAKARKYAVSDLSINLFKSHVTALLGHNGAGKTTAMNIITGMCATTRGQVWVSGREIRSRGDVLRSSIGTCPQHNVLFSKLTVREHLRLYSRMKAPHQTVQEMKDEVEEMLSALQLCEKSSELVDSLSGGMKRRLSVAIAFIGGSTTVVLDEPTAGIDPFARRSIWEMILKYREGRSILIATHLMDEADVLADRIAIISRGRLTAVGSPLYLKENFGEGYYIVFAVRAFPVEANEGYSEKAGPSTAFQFECHTSRKIMEMLCEFGPQPLLVSSYPSEKTFLLKGWNEVKIIALLRFLEIPGKVAELGITSYGIRDTTLQEIFMKFGSKVDDELGCENANDLKCEMTKEESELSETFELPRYNRTGSEKRAIAQYVAVLYKRFWCVLRNWKTLFSQLLLPVIFVVGGMTIALPSIILGSPPPLNINTFQFSNLSSGATRSTVFYANEAAGDESSHSDKRWVCSSSLIESLYEVPGVGAECSLASPTETWIDANWPPNWIYLNRSVSMNSLIKNCQWRTSAVHFFRNESLSYFRIPDYIAPKNDTESYYPHCWCSTQGSGFACNGATNHSNHRTLYTGDELYDLTGLDLNRYLVNTANEFELRYGGLSFGLEKENVPVDYGVNVSDKLRILAVRHLSKVWYNNRAFHAMPIFLNIHNNALLRAAVRRNPNMSDVNPAAFGISLTNHPMAGSTEAISEQKILEGNDVLIAVFLVMGMSFVPASFIYFLVLERSSLCLHLQTMAGLSRLVYWFANLTWDLVNYSLPAALCAAIIWAFNIPVYTNGDNLMSVIALIFMFGYASTPLVYLLSFLFTDASNAHIAMLVLNLFVGISTVFTSFLLQLFGLKEQSLMSLEEVLRKVFAVFPGFCLGRGVMDVAFNDYYNQYYELVGEQWSIKSPLCWDILYRNLVAMFSVGAIAFALTVIIDCFPRDAFREWIHSKMPLLAWRSIAVKRNPTDDSDVAVERDRILCGFAADDVIRVEELTKVYRKRRRKGGDEWIHAVDGLCVGVPKGECFGLLGVNGAGKTTTFRMLSGIIPPTRGSASVSGHKIARNSKTLSRIGYCPQFDALYEELTAREHLHYYAAIHGYQWSVIKKLVCRLLVLLDLVNYADVSVDAYSGGTRRKLSVAIALIGNPEIVLLDEPSTGMDPGARKFLESIITRLCKAGKCILLTSHSMEECEELCGRLSIMVNGGMRCLGSCQHLKDKYGNGYSVRVRLAKDTSEEVRTAVQNFFCKRVPEATLKETHFSYIHFEVSGSPRLSLLFEVCGYMRSDGQMCVQCYSISQNNLDNVFITFVRQQQNEGTDSDSNRTAFASTQCPVAVSPSSNPLSNSFVEVPPVECSPAAQIFPWISV